MKQSQLEAKTQRLSAGKCMKPSWDDFDIALTSQKMARNLLRKRFRYQGMSFNNNDLEVAHPQSGFSSALFLIKLEFGNVGL